MPAGEPGQGFGEDERSGPWARMPATAHLPAVNSSLIQIILGAVATVAFAIGSWAANNIIDLRVDLEKVNERIESNARDRTRLEEQLRALPVRVEFDGLRAEIIQLRAELRDVRDDLRRKR